MILWIIIGIAIGYHFKPQIENGIQKLQQFIRDRQNKFDD